VAAEAFAGLFGGAIVLGLIYSAIISFVLLRKKRGYAINGGRRTY